MIDGVNIKKLVKHVDERGLVMEFIRRDEELFKGFGQVYLTQCNPGFVKGWHYHKKQIDSFVCVKGKAKVVLYDKREESKTKGQLNEFFISLDEPQLIQIPPGVVHGFECVDDKPAIIVNTCSEPYNKENPDEFRYPFDSEEIPYKWNSKKGG